MENIVQLFQCVFKGDIKIICTCDPLGQGYILMGARSVPVFHPDRIKFNDVFRPDEECEVISCGS